MAKKKKWSGVLKFEIALLAIKNEMTLSEICKRYEVAPSQVHSWKKQVLTQGSELFKKVEKGVKLALEHESEKCALFETIGQLTVERDFLKKASLKLMGLNGKT